jgi:membrane protein DedA with SNARE-associated domain
VLGANEMRGSKAVRGLLRLLAWLLAGSLVWAGIVTTLMAAFWVDIEGPTPMGHRLAWCLVGILIVVAGVVMVRFILNANTAAGPDIPPER